MNDTAAADAVKARVEDTLRQAVDLITVTPCRVARRVGETITTALGLTRSVAGLVLGSVLARGETYPSGRPRPGPSMSRDRSTTVVADVEDFDDDDDDDEDDDGRRPADAATTLPLEGYESLAASQVVARLGRLTPAELEQVREFERSHRGRRTILGKIEQLLDA
jgi:hypothetical protein